MKTRTNQPIYKDDGSPLTEEELLPKATSSDAGKVVGVNEDGDYELIEQVTSQMHIYIFNFAYGTFARGFCLYFSPNDFQPSASNLISDIYSRNANTDTRSIECPQLLIINNDTKTFYETLGVYSSSSIGSNVKFTVNKIVYGNTWEVTPYSPQNGQNISVTVYNVYKIS